MILSGGGGGDLFSCKFTLGVVTVAASAVNCSCFFRVDLLVTFDRNFLSYSLLRSFINRAMKVARAIALFQQEQKQEGKNLSIYLQSVSPET